MSCNICGNNNETIMLKNGTICKECFDKLPRCTRDYKDKLTVEIAKELIDNGNYKIPLVAFFNNRSGELGACENLLYLAGYRIPVKNIQNIYSLILPIEKISERYYKARIGIMVTLKKPHVKLTEEIGTYEVEKEDGDWKFRLPEKLRSIIYLNAKKTQENSSQGNQSNTNNDYNYNRQNGSGSSQRRSSNAEQDKALAMATLCIINEPFTEKELKANRNRLLKAFHPDEDAGISAEYAAKINNAYELLKQYCTKD